MKTTLKLELSDPPKITVRHGKNGGMEVLVGDWVFVQINYDYRYTDNAHRMQLAQRIAEILISERLQAIEALSKGTK